MKPNEYKYCYFCREEHLASEFSGNERYCRASRKQKTRGTHTELSDRITFSVRERQDSGLVLRLTNDHYATTSRRNDDLLKNDFLRYKSNEQVLEEVQSAITNATIEKAYPKPVPFMEWDKFLETKIVTKTKQRIVNHI